MGRVNYYVEGFVSRGSTGLTDAEPAPARAVTHPLNFINLRLESPPKLKIEHVAGPGERDRHLLWDSDGG